MKKLKTCWPPSLRCGLVSSYLDHLVDGRRLDSTPRGVLLGVAGRRTALAGCRRRRKRGRRRQRNTVTRRRPDRQRLGSVTSSCIGLSVAIGG